ncbi:GNAT family N-acetyltransferase [Vibrio breoganii]|uniref:GNAT family N-acetyltransferase n=1 Tax=Vibrio breoganii TaxID=553239 RepID=UPI000C81A76E|nr:GNAT family N-acetyltransferase [Vibrio breoganii]PML92247.1 hypothetical protein BCT64_16645 [Vibrio breoganii]PMN70186.1 hypothetical protein BCT28_17925 [Vibrio breoganii]
MVTCIKYDESRKVEWDLFVKNSKQNLFLFYRDFMEYHSDRFIDHSLMFYFESELVAIFPANEVGDKIYSHGGLTFGGLVTSQKFRTSSVNSIFDSLLDYFNEYKCTEIYYKIVPYFLCNKPAEEAKYQLYLNKATLEKCEVSSIINLNKGYKLSKGRKALISKAKKNGLTVEHSNEWSTYHTILSEVLSKHQATPTHSSNELIKLSSLFPENIKLYTAKMNGEILAGVVLFDFGIAAHTQYIATTELGKEYGALDFLIKDVIDSVSNAKDYFSFGISTESGGTILNSGLLSQKESFGARTAVLETYRLKL